MSDDHTPDQRSRARLEAIVFGRDDAVTDVERAGAAEELARLVEEEQARDTEAPQPHPRTPVVPDANDATKRAGSPELEVHALTDGAAKSRWWRRIAVAAIALAAVIVLGLAVRVVAFGWQPFGTSDSMAIFDRPQTEQDRAFSLENIGIGQHDDSIRYVGSESGYDAYVYRVDEREYGGAGWVACLAVVRDGQLIRNECLPESAFSAGIATRTVSAGRWAEVHWDIAGGLIVTTGNVPPIPPPLSVFDEQQDDADLNALEYLPDIPPSQQDTVHFIGSSAGYYVAAYRDADDAVCLAVYEGGTTLATSEAACVSEAEFEASGIHVIYPAAAPEVEVTWGIGPGLAFGGR